MKNSIVQYAINKKENKSGNGEECLPQRPERSCWALCRY